MQKNQFYGNVIVLLLLIIHIVTGEQFVESSHKLVSSIPIHLDLKRFTRGTNSSAVAVDPKLRKSLKEGRTKPLFFQQALGLKIGQPFTFDLNKWRQIRESNLFSDLSIVSFDTEDDTVALDIEGYERPSRHFSSGVNIPANLASPELEVGFSLEDRNFRGLGETVRVSVYEREKIDVDTSGSNAKLPVLPPRLSFLWKENGIGKASQLSVTYTEDHNFFKPLNLIPNCLQKKFEAAGGEQGESVQMTLYNGGINLDGSFDTSKWSKNIFLKPFHGFIENMNYRWSPFRRKMTFKMGVDATSDTYTDSIGARTSLFTKLKNGFDLSGWYEGGYLNSNRRTKKYTFNQIGVDIISPEFSVYKATAPKKIKATTDEKKKKSKKSKKIDRFDMVGMMRSRFVRAWGAGCVPMNHHGCASSPAYSRAYFGDSDTSFNHASAIGSIKLDLKLRNLLSFGTIGAFLDGAVFIDAAEERKKKFEDGDELIKLKTANALGMSLSSIGLRVDCAVPITFDQPARLYLRLEG